MNARLNLALSRVGARLGNWNDRRFGQHDSRADMPITWVALDRAASWLYVRGDLVRRP